MRRALISLLVLPLAALAHGDEREPLFNLVSLAAQAEREVANDLLSAVLAAEAEGTDAAKLAAGVNRKMARALEAAQGVRSVRARSGGYQSEKGRIVRWRVRQELRLESADFAAATALIGRLQQELVVARLAATVSDEARRRAENVLTAEALAAFEERARVVRDAMKAKGYRVQALQIGGGGGAPRPMLAMQSRAEAAAPAIEPGTSRLQVTVSGTIQLQ
jgi:predicted secreted protein